MNTHHVVHRNVAHIDIDEELQGEVRRLIERVDRQVEQWSHDHPATRPPADRSPLILDDDEAGEGGTH